MVSDFILKKSKLLQIMTIGVLCVPLSHAESLRVEAVLKSSNKKDSPFFRVETKIRNVSNRQQTIITWTCSHGFSWIATRPEIITGTEPCLSNFTGNTILNPQQEYVRDINIAVTGKFKPGSITFQLGFNPKGDWIGSRMGIIPKVELPNFIIWSNDITINITEDMLPNVIPLSKELIVKSKHLYCDAYPC